MLQGDAELQDADILAEALWAAARDVFLASCRAKVGWQSELQLSPVPMLLMHRSLSSLVALAHVGPLSLAALQVRR